MDTEKTIDISNLANATYIIRIVSNQGEILKKLVKE